MSLFGHTHNEFDITCDRPTTNPDHFLRPCSGSKLIGGRLFNHLYNDSVINPPLQPYRPRYTPGTVPGKNNPDPVSWSRSAERELRSAQPTPPCHTVCSSDSDPPSLLIHRSIRASDLGESGDTPSLGPSGPTHTRLPRPNRPCPSH